MTARTDSSAQRPRTTSNLLTGLCLLLVTIAAYSGALRSDFVDIDDGAYVVGNSHVNSGPSASNIAWAFTSLELSNWHPATWISLQIDSRLFAMRPWGFHLTNVLLHAANTLILFLLLRSATGKLVESATVAAIFGLHPLHVESVAWVTERKDVLSTFFGFLALAAYSRYAARPSIARSLLVTALLALSLMAKPMFVTFPFVALLWDYWPLGRWRRKSTFPHSGPLPKGEGMSLLRLIAEKTPFFVLAAALSIATFYAQRSTGAVVAISGLTILERLQNAFVAYVQYVRQSLWPANLIVFYPLPEHIPLWEPCAAAALLAIVTGLVLWFGGRARYLVMGWFWFLGTLVPVIGLVQVGMQTTADRYMYVPMVGLSVMIVWGLYDVAARVAPRGRAALTGGFVVLLAICAVLTHRQVGYWQDRQTLWQHALDVMPDNYRANAQLATHAIERGDAAAARRLAERSLADQPNAMAHLVLALADFQGDHLESAADHYHQALQLSSRAVPDALNGLGAIEATRGNFEAAESNFRQALSQDPAFSTAHNNLGLALLKQGKIDEAAPWFEGACRLDPAFAEAFKNLATAYVFDERWKDALTVCATAVELSPNQASIRPLLASVLWEVKDRREAKRQYQIADRLEAGWRQKSRQEARSLLKSETTNRYVQQKALLLLRQLCEAADPSPAAEDLALLARAYVASGQTERGRAIAQRARNAALAAGNGELAAQIAEEFGVDEERVESRK